jgi:FkbM family methyltransferase
LRRRRPRAVSSSTSGPTRATSASSGQAARPDNRVLAFEASPRVLARLEGNIARNGFDERIVLVRAAASDAAGELSFLLGPEDQLGWGGVAPAGPPETECVTVAAVRVDEVVGDRPVAVMKVDVEGAEPLVLRGCRRLLERRQIGIVYYECNAVRLAALGFVAEDMHRELRQHGYRCLPLDAAGNEWMATPPA